MTDECYKAKQWLRRAHKFALKVEADARMLEILAGRVNSAVAKYESDGASVDREAARKRKEDDLLSYSDQRALVEKEQLQLIKEMTKSRQIIKQMRDPVLESIAINRYVDRLGWDDVVKLNHYSRAQIFRLHLKMLEELAKVLQAKKII